MKKNIVLVEDSSFVRSLLRHDLIKRDFAVYDVKSGEDLFKAKKFNPSVSEPGILDRISVDLFIIDIELAGINGIEILGLLKAHADFKDTPVIVNSSHNDKETIIAAIKAGAADYVLKKDNFVQVLAAKIDQFFEQELHSFESTLKREVDWIRYGGKELALAIASLRHKDVKIKVDNKIFDDAMSAIKKTLRQYDWIFRVDDRFIAVILPLSNVKSAIIIRDRMLKQLENINDGLDSPLNIAIGFSHFPSIASTPDELITLAKSHLE